MPSCKCFVLSPTEWSPFQRRCARLLKSRSYAFDRAGKRTPKSCAFGPRSGCMPANPAMLMCLQGLDRSTRMMHESHVTYHHEVSHCIVFIQAAGGVSDSRNLLILTQMLWYRLAYQWAFLRPSVSWSLWGMWCSALSGLHISYLSIKMSQQRIRRSGPSDDELNSAYHQNNR